MSDNADRTQESYDENHGELPVGGAVHPDALDADAETETSAEADEAQTASRQALATDDVSGGGDSVADHSAGGGAGDDTGSHHGRDGLRDTLTAGESQQAAGPGGEQLAPAMSQNNASEVDKIAGIVAQTRQDLGAASTDEVQRVLGQRLVQSGIDLPDAQIAELAARVSSGS